MQAGGKEGCLRGFARTELDRTEIDALKHD